MTYKKTAREQLDKQLVVYSGSCRHRRNRRQRVFHRTLPSVLVRLFGVTDIKTSYTYAPAHRQCQTVVAWVFVQSMYRHHRFGCSAAAAAICMRRLGGGDTLCVVYVIVLCCVRCNAMVNDDLVDFIYACAVSVRAIAFNVSRRCGAACSIHLVVCRRRRSRRRVHDTCPNVPSGRCTCCVGLQAAERQMPTPKPACFAVHAFALKLINNLMHALRMLHARRFA